jgi:hypothetical protein
MFIDLKIALTRKWLTSLLFRAAIFGFFYAVSMFATQLYFGGWNRLSSPAAYAYKLGSMVFVSCFIGLILGLWFGPRRD